MSSMLDVSVFKEGVPMQASMDLDPSRFLDPSKVPPGMLPGGIDPKDVRRAQGAAQGAIKGAKRGVMCGPIGMMLCGACGMLCS